MGDEYLGLEGLCPCLDLFLSECALEVLKLCRFPQRPSLAVQRRAVHLGQLHLWQHKTACNGTRRMQRCQPLVRGQATFLFAAQVLPSGLQLFSELGYLPLQRLHLLLGINPVISLEKRLLHQRETYFSCVTDQTIKKRNVGQ